MEEDKPLVTFILMTFNHERFVSEAVSGALNQDYEQIEFIFSDDASQDSTCDIIKSIVDGHRRKSDVRMFRNSQNLGVAHHTNRVLGLARGELIVMAAGDDISLPHRTTKLVNLWLEHGKPAGVGSTYYLIDETGKTEQEVPSHIADRARHFSQLDKRCQQVSFSRGTNPLIIGSTGAWSSDLWGKFGEITQKGALEDLVLSFRALLMTGIQITDEPLVYYRKHENNLWNNKEKKTAREERRRAKLRINSAYVKMKDLFRLKNQVEIGIFINITKRLFSEIMLNTKRWIFAERRAKRLAKRLA